jgi:hypothetical protein
MRSFVVLLVVSGLLITHSALALERTRLGLEGERESVLTTGLSYQSGDYGTPDTTTVWTIPVNYSFRQGQYGLFVSVPFLAADSTGDEIIVNSQMAKKKKSQTVSTSSTGSSASGLGDVVASASYFFPTDHQHDMSYRITGIVKLPTADESNGLGTGEMDISLEGGAIKDIDEYRLAFTLGYEINGDSPVYEYNDVLYGIVGLTKELARKRQAGLALYTSQVVTPGGEAPLEISGFYRQPLSEKQVVSAYLSKGLTNGSPDYFLGGYIEFHF